MWDPVRRLINTWERSVYFPSLPGHAGRLLPEEINMDSWVHDVLLQLPANKKFTLIGHSMGGYLSARMGVLYPERIHQICFFHSKAGDDGAEKKENRMRAIDAARTNQSLYVRAMISGLYDPQGRVRHDHEIEAQVRYAQALPLETIEASQRVMHDRPDSVDALHQLGIPVWYFAGEHDASIPLPVMQDEVRRMGNPVLHIARNTGHMGHYECPAESAAFFQKVIDNG